MDVRNILQLPHMCWDLGTNPQPRQSYAPTGNCTHDLLVHGMMLQPAKARWPGKGCILEIFLATVWGLIWKNMRLKAETCLNRLLQSSWRELTKP